MAGDHDRGFGVAARRQAEGFGIIAWSIRCRAGVALETQLQPDVVQGLVAGVGDPVDQGVEQAAPQPIVRVRGQAQRRQRERVRQALGVVVVDRDHAVVAVAADVAGVDVVGLGLRQQGHAQPRAVGVAVLSDRARRPGQPGRMAQFDVVAGDGAAVAGMGPAQLGRLAGVALDLQVGDR